LIDKSLDHEPVEAAELLFFWCANIVTTQVSSCCKEVIHRHNEIAGSEAAVLIGKRLKSKAVNLLTGLIGA
jgi:hypothetical protein